MGGKRIKFKIKGKELSLYEILEDPELNRHNLNYDHVYYRHMVSGWPLMEALNTPVQRGDPLVEHGVICRNCAGMVYPVDKLVKVGKTRIAVNPAGSPQLCEKCQEREEDELAAVSKLVLDEVA